VVVARPTPDDLDVGLDVVVLVGRTVVGDTPSSVTLMGLVSL